ncbi:MAG: hypothetical protein AAF585_05060 [Verrucomicrobiota bacterium]
MKIMFGRSSANPAAAETHRARIEIVKRIIRQEKPKMVNEANRFWKLIDKLGGGYVSA